MNLDLRFDEVFDRPIEAVWRAITDPRLLARWLMENDFEPKCGHKFTLRETPTAAWRGWIACEVLELDPPRRMVWSWDGGMDGERTTRVVFELRSEGAGTRLVFRHEGDAPAERGASLRAGWERRLAFLRDVAGPSYAGRVVVAASREKLFDAITTVDGLRGWWTPIVRGCGTSGGELTFGFEGLDEEIVMRVDIATRPDSVRWTCIRHSSLPDWNGTRLTFDVVPRGLEACELHFRHVGLTPALECYDQCELGWDHFLKSLAGLVERGTGAPFRAAPARGTRTGGKRK